jgi:hypothetical protein
MGNAIYKIEFLGVEAPSDELCDTFRIEMIGWAKEMIPHDIQRTRPNGGTPVMKNVSGL